MGRKEGLGDSQAQIRLSPPQLQLLPCGCRWGGQERAARPPLAVAMPGSGGGSHRALHTPVKIPLADWRGENDK